MAEVFRDDQDLWRAFKLNGDRRARDELIVRYAPLVKYVAGRMAIHLARRVEQDDLIGYGACGLIDAIERFDPWRGVRFETYAIARIKGAMIDGLRAMDWVPASLRHKSKQVERAMRQLENRLGRSATDEEIAQELGWTMDEFYVQMNALAGTSILSVEDIWTSPDDVTGTSVPDVRDDRATNPLDEAEWTSKREELARAIQRLPEREKLVVTLYYYEGLTVKEIGQVLGVSPSRVSQIHTRAVMRLRAHLAPG